MEQYRDYPAYRAGVVVKCGVCLGVVSIIALMGAHEPGADRTGAVFISHESASMQHSRALREQRMAAYAAKQAAPVARATVTAACAGNGAARRQGEQPRVLPAACVN